MSIKQHRVRLLELRRKVSELIECELALLDEEEIREAKETNSRLVPPIAEPITKGGPEEA